MFCAREDWLGGKAPSQEPSSEGMLGVTLAGGSQPGTHIGLVLGSWARKAGLEVLGPQLQSSQRSSGCRLLGASVSPLEREGLTRFSWEMT